MSQHRGQHRFDIGDKRSAVFADAPGALFFAPPLREGSYFRFEGGAILDDPAADLGKVGGGRGGGQPRRGGDQRPALLRHPERRREGRHAPLVHPTLDLADAHEGHPADHRCGEGHYHRAGDAQIELGRYA